MSSKLSHIAKRQCEKARMAEIASKVGRPPTLGYSQPRKEMPSQSTKIRAMDLIALLSTLGNDLVAQSLLNERRAKEVLEPSAIEEEARRKNPVVPCPICGFELVSARWQICQRCGATILSGDITL